MFCFIRSKETYIAASYDIPSLVEVLKVEAGELRSMKFGPRTLLRVGC